MLPRLCRCQLRLPSATFGFPMHRHEAMRCVRRVLGTTLGEFFAYNLAALYLNSSIKLYHNTYNDMASLAAFTPQTAKAALTNILGALNSPENMQKITEAKENSGNEMLKMMQFVFPIVTQIQMDVIKNFGFPEGREGTVQFSQLVRTLEREDPEIAQLHAQVRAYFLPPVTISSSTEASL